MNGVAVRVRRKKGLGRARTDLRGCALAQGRAHGSPGTRAPPSAWRTSTHALPRLRWGGVPACHGRVRAELLPSASLASSGHPLYPTTFFYGLPPTLPFPPHFPATHTFPAFHSGSEINYQGLMVPDWLDKGIIILQYGKNISL